MRRGQGTGQLYLDHYRWVNGSHGEDQRVRMKGCTKSKVNEKREQRSMESRTSVRVDGGEVWGKEKYIAGVRSIPHVQIDCQRWV